MFPVIKEDTFFVALIKSCQMQNLYLILYLYQLAFPIVIMENNKSYNYVLSFLATNFYIYQPILTISTLLQLQK